MLFRVCNVKFLEDMQRNPIFIQSYLKRSTRKLFREEPVQRLHVWQITLNTDCDNVSFSEPAKYRNKLKHINSSSSQNQQFIYPPPPRALTITPIFGEGEFVFSTRIPIIILFVAVKQNECDGQSVELLLRT